MSIEREYQTTTHIFVADGEIVFDVSRQVSATKFLVVRERFTNTTFKDLGDAFVNAYRTLDDAEGV